MGERIVHVSDLHVRAGGNTLLDGVGFDVAAGRMLAVVGASGSGKTTTASALLGALRPGADATGTVEVGGVDALRCAPGALPAAYLPQHPAAVLNPVRRIGGVLTDIARASGGGEVRARVADAMHRAGLDDPALLRRFHHQLSGGQQQRLVLAQAFLCEARLLVVDEPTTGQDLAHRDQVAAELRLAVANGLAVVLLSHDLDLVAAISDETAVLERGSIVEHGTTGAVFERPAHEYTRRLLAARTGSGPRVATTGAPAPIRIEGTGLTVTAGRARTRILDEVDFHVRAGECLAIVGASGSGKTTLARCIAGLQRADAGSLALDGVPLSLGDRRRTRAERAKVQYVFQDARGAFDEHRDIVSQVARTAIRLRALTTREARAEAERLLDEVGLTTATASRRRDRLSGGQLQRAALARALAARPDVLICDEITSGLDAITQRGILDLLDELMARTGVSLLLITHEPAVADRLADRTLRLAQGRAAHRSVPSPQ
ncbi:ABC transporter ATP-binding protein [Glycomyces tritici]|uniref:ATP-binding cassette domain-containing protein n=1 Tax=Glycomyces tritici TaxID=2665176 RepID=A0ABT7YI83_9ACTN|nr:ATP-binding cassette domain-containing protein [Glycomyces tritici]MDN3238334.1 ATP-binding cassette domain-containing protein [Glycomyces tritici]